LGHRPVSSDADQEAVMRLQRWRLSLFCTPTVEKLSIGLTILRGPIRFNLDVCGRFNRQVFGCNGIFWPATDSVKQQYDRRSLRQPLKTQIVIPTMGRQ
jgi:hypothetical protein